MKRTIFFNRKNTFLYLNSICIFVVSVIPLSHIFDVSQMQHSAVLLLAHVKYVPT